MGCLLSALPAAPPPPSPRRGVKPTTSGSSVAAGEACGDLTGTGARLESHYTTGKQIGKYVGLPRPAAPCFIENAIQL